MVDTTLDKLIKQAIEESNEIVTPGLFLKDGTEQSPAKILSEIPVFFIGDKLMMKHTAERIVFGRSDNQNDSEGFDFTDRKLHFVFYVQIKDTDYLATVDLLNQIENALVRTLMNSELLANYNETMNIDDIKPYYQGNDLENIMFHTDEVYVSFVITEDYSTTDVGFDKVTIRGSVKNGS